jgi:tetratricopeptide (TPR) repeat protein
VIGKFVDGAADSEANAEQALRRALAIDPRLSVAHKFYAALEADMGMAPRAIDRLLREAARHSNDPELFAGLVQALRFGGLYEEAVAAHDEARRLDPNIPTSVEQALLMTGDLERLLGADRPTTSAGDDGIRAIRLGLGGRRDDARDVLLAMRGAADLAALRAWSDFLLAWLDRRPADMAAHLAGFSSLNIQHDPEAIFLVGWLACDVGEHQTGLGFLQRAVTAGYSAAPTLARRPQFDALRSSPEFAAVQAAADDGHRRALDAFRAAGGERLLGTHPGST